MAEVLDVTAEDLAAMQNVARRLANEEEELDHIVTEQLDKIAKDVVDKETISAVESNLEVDYPETNTLPKVIKVVPDLGYGIEDMPISVDTDFINLNSTRIKELIDTLPKSEDNVPSVYIDNKGNRDFMSQDLMMIKALHDIFPGLSEFQTYGSGFIIICRQPFAVIINDYKQEHRLREVFCRIIFTTSGNRRHIDGISWMRPVRSCYEHAQRFTLSHANATNPGNWATCCLGSSDLSYLSADTKDHSFSYEMACLLLVSIKGYTASEFIDGVPDISIGDLHGILQINITEVLKASIYSEYKRMYNHVEGLCISSSGGMIKTTIDNKSPEFLDQIFHLPSSPKVIYSAHQFSYGIPVRHTVNVDTVNKEKISCGKFRGQQLYYSVFNEDIDESTLNWIPHPDIVRYVAIKLEEQINSQTIDLSLTISPEIPKEYALSLIKNYMVKDISLIDLIKYLNTRINYGSTKDNNTNQGDTGYEDIFAEL
jgi:hypothetical protein